jgi:hypothetical protein
VCQFFFDAASFPPVSWWFRVEGDHSRSASPALGSSGAVTKTLTKRRSEWIPAANAKALITPSGLFCGKSRLSRREQIDLAHTRRGCPQLLRHPVTSSIGP